MLRVPPFRGDQVAAGVVVLSVLVVLLQLRMGWPTGGQLALASGASVVVGVLLAGCPREARPYVSAHVTSLLVLLAVMLVRLGEALGVDDLFAPGAAVWRLAVLGLAAALLARAYDAAVATLVAGLAAALWPLALFSWVLDPSDGVRRLLLLVMAVVLALGAVGRRDRRPTHAAQLANAGGLALAALAAGPLAGGAVQLLVGGPADGVAALGWGWEVPLLLGGFGLLAYGAVDRQRGPVLVGVVVLAAFAAAAAEGGAGSLLGWPVVLAAAAGLMLVVGLRPTTPAPPEPGAEAEHEPLPPLPLR